jgi:RNA polymerase sigma-B factor
MQLTASKRSQEQELFTRYHEAGDFSAREQLIRQCLPLARRLASRYGRSGEQMDDLLQVASIGLIKAVDRFDPTRGTAFSSFAVPSIQGELKRYFRDHTWSARVPRDLQERVLKINTTIERLSGGHGHTPTMREIAAATGLSVEEVLEGMEAAEAYSASSLDAPAPGEDGEGGSSYGESIGQLDERFELVDYRSVVESTVRALPERERRVLALRFYEDMTQAEIADRIGVSQMHVSRLIRRALDRLRTVADAQAELPIAR